jgi:hypothetical protein
LPFFPKAVPAKQRGTIFLLSWWQEYSGPDFLLSFPCLPGAAALFKHTSVLITAMVPISKFTGEVKSGAEFSIPKRFVVLKD